MDKSNGRLRWSEQEVIVLKEAVQNGMTMAEIMELLGRSESAIASLAARRAPIRYGPARVGRDSPFQLIRTAPSSSRRSTAEWTAGIASRQAAPGAIARATSLGQTVEPGDRDARISSAMSPASVVIIVVSTVSSIHTKRRLRPRAA